MLKYKKTCTDTSVAYLIILKFLYLSTLLSSSTQMHRNQGVEMEVAEMKILRFAVGVMRKDKIRNEYIRSTVKVERLGIKMRDGRLRWYGHVMRRDQEYVGRKMMEMELPGKKEKRETKEDIFRYSKRRYEGNWWRRRRMLKTERFGG